MNPVMSYRFDGLTFNGSDTVTMSQDLARLIQRMRIILGSGNITHMGIYNRRYARTVSGDPIYVNGRRLVSGHAWHDAIDITGWGNKSLDVISSACRASGGRSVPEGSIGVVHCEVNYPHFEFR